MSEHEQAIWLDELFEFENCGECLRGAEGHIVTSVLWNPFAVCLMTLDEAEKEVQRLGPN